jgi:hypothetical protein
MYKGKPELKPVKMQISIRRLNKDWRKLVLSVIWRKYASAALIIVADLTKFRKATIFDQAYHLGKFIVGYIRGNFPSLEE